MKQNRWHQAIVLQLRAAKGPLTVSQIWKSLATTGFRHGSKLPKSTLGARLAELAQQKKIEHAGDVPAVEGDHVVRKIQIALDCDGILSDFTAGALRIVEEVTGKRFVPADVGEFDFTKALGLSTAEAIEVKKVIGSRQGFAASLAPYPRAHEGVRYLRELGDVFCVTSPWDSNPWWRSEREAWLAKHFGIDRVIHAEDKSGYPADVFVDDRSKHVRAWVGAHPKGVAVLWRTPHNTSEAVPPGAHSIGSWDVLYEVARGAALGPVQQSLPEVRDV